MSDNDSFHLKYRPSNLEECIGHTDAVTRLKGMIANNKLPNALLFTGPSSVGKTTLARAFAVEVNGKPIDQQRQSYMEMNASDQRSIDDIRNLVQISKFRPDCKRRIICIDEAQGVLSGGGAGAAAACLLKPLEEPSAATTWILCSMDPSKFVSGNGKAIANRCAPFVLEPHSNGDLLKMAIRIAKGERMKYVNKELLKTVVRSSDQQMRKLANLMQALRDYYYGLDTKPAMLEESHIASVLSSTESSDDVLVVQVVVSMFCGKYAMVQRALLDVSDGFAFINKLLYASSFLLNNAVLDGARHPKVWWSATNKAIMEGLKKAQVKPTLGQLALVQTSMVELKARAGSFAVGEVELVSATMYRVIKDLYVDKKGE